MKTRKRTQNLKRYSKQFCDQVRKDFPILANLEKQKYPVIKCYASRKGTKINDYLTEKQVVCLDNGIMEIDGYYSYKNKVIEIYGITKRPIRELKESVRHECLHFLLNDAGLPCKDEDETFLAFSIRYNANPYGLLARPDMIEKLNKMI